MSDDPSGLPTRQFLEAELGRLRESEDRLRAENEHLLEAQRELEQSLNHYVEMYDLAPVAWLTLDRDGIVRDINLLAATLLGSPRRYLTGIPLKVLIVPDDRRRFLDHLSAVLNSADATRCELRILGNAAEAFPALLVTRRPRGANGVYVIAVIDLRERVLAEEERARLASRERAALAANEAKDQFIAMLSHELRTPLTPVLAAVSVLAERPNLSRELRSIFAMLERNVTAEARLIDDLLDVTRISRGKMQVQKKPVDLHVILREAFDTLQSEIESKRHSTLLMLSSAEHWVNGDPMRLRQVFWNILRNAIKFTPEGGRIEIRSWCRDGKVVLEVSDTGCGIHPESLERVFTAFEQVDELSTSTRGGLGLGLAICRGIIELHDGQIIASSNGPDQGSRFQIELGTIEEPAWEPAAPRSSSRPPPRGKSRILLVEDHEDTRALLCELLSSVGYEVQAADSFAAALAAELQAGDIVVSDVGLGDGSGLDLVKLLKAKAPVKAIALSGFGTEADKRISLEAGFAVHLTKPVNFEKLLEAIGGVGR